MTIYIKEKKPGWEVFSGHGKCIGKIYASDTNVVFDPYVNHSEHGKSIVSPISLDDMAIITEFMQDQL